MRVTKLNINRARALHLAANCQPHRNPQDLYQQPVSKLVEFIVACQVNPDIEFEVFVHKAEKLQEDDNIGLLVPCVSIARVTDTAPRKLPSDTRNTASLKAFLFDTSNKIYIATDRQISRFPPTPTPPPTATTSTPSKITAAETLPPSSSFPVRRGLVEWNIVWFREGF
ncbi:hypothetical protein EV702DRAFT_1047079 [Suillus placidus]|uniref:Uncharacterized protein n=1 Tax=Suillus placidus TaxID=48579 RepID=A0A9P7D0P7_9AGAM|nr:hypothetical protein EV702DRAFT_1047079 [Suillus placidus]